MLFGYIPKYYECEVRILTDKQRLFCEWYVSTGNATESAKKAGYSEKSASNQGCRLMKNDEIQKFIKEKQHKLAESVIDNDELLAFWARIMRDNGEKMSNRLTASNNIAKMIGAYRDDFF